MTSADPTTPERARRMARAITWVRLPTYAFALWLACDVLDDWATDWQLVTMLLLGMAVLAMETLAVQYPDREASPFHRFALALIAFSPLLALVVAMRNWIAAAFSPPPETDSVILILSDFGESFPPMDWLVAAAVAVGSSIAVPIRILRWLLPACGLVTFAFLTLAVAPG